MMLRTPLSRALGDGSAKEGVGHWWVQRLTAVALIPLGVWFAASLLTMDSLAFDRIHAWVAQPLHSAAMLLLVLCLTWHSSLGVQVVIEDYVHHRGLKVFSLILSRFAHAAVAAAGTFALLRIAMGAAA
jgi:succinate dehydrogenase / fumarate reductase membrane anchor subunit